jgi:dihydrofolate reductase
MIKMIVAKSNNNVIGKDNKLPWHLPQELKLFKTLTTNNIVLMGRKTYESIGKELPNRVNVVISRIYTDTFSIHINIENLIFFDSIEKSIIRLKEDYPSKIIYIIGGKTIYDQFYDKVDEILVSNINIECEGDTYFDEKWLSNFYLYDAKNMDGFSFNRFKRLNNT